MNAVMQEDWITRHRITVDEYYRMVEVGLLAPDARVELIEGEIIDMAPIGNLHGGTARQIGELLSQAVGSQAIVSLELPVRLSKASEPQPDISVLKRRTDYYKSAHPTAEDTLLVIEISKTTLRYDREIKVPLYARHGIPEVWVVDLKGSQILFFRTPTAGAYADVSSTKTPGVVTLSALPDVTLDLSAVLRV
jgi:Uma2 family endonuclease